MCKCDGYQELKSSGTVALILDTVVSILTIGLSKNTEILLPITMLNSLKYKLLGVLDIRCFNGYQGLGLK